MKHTCHWLSFNDNAHDQSPRYSTFLQNAKPSAVAASVYPFTTHTQESLKIIIMMISNKLYSGLRDYTFPCFLYTLEVNNAKVKR